MRKITAIAAAAIALTALGACAAPRTTPAAATHSAAPAVATQPATVTPTAGNPTPPARMLTTRQAAAAYVRIIDPANRADAVVNTDYTDKAPLSQFRADILAEWKAWRTSDRKLGAVRWPAAVQPYITAMRLTFDPATIRCLHVLASAANYAAFDNTVASNQDCVAQSTNTDADTVRSMLGLPSRN